MKLPSLKNILLGKKYIGIEHFSLDNEELISLLLVENKKNELVILEKNKQNYSDVFIEKLNTKLPFYLIINTNNVIQKEILDTDISDQKIIHKTFPNVAWDEFYYEIWRLKTKTMVAISRKSYVDELVLKYEKKGISVVGISLGVCSINEIAPFSVKKEFGTNTQSISLLEENQTISSFNSSLAIEYDINGIGIRNSHLLAFSGVLRLLTTAKTSGNIIDHNHKRYDDFNQKSFFRKGIQAMVGFLLLLLLINFLFFNNYYKKSLDANEKLQLNYSSQEKVSSLKTRVNQKEKQLNTISNVNGEISSLMINNITKGVPNTILLSELVLNPLEKKIKNEEEIIFMEKSIIISGSTLKNEDFTKWIEKIEQLKFVKEVVINHFGKNENLETVFLIKVIVKKDDA